MRFENLLFLFSNRWRNEFQWDKISFNGKEIVKEKVIIMLNKIILN